MKKLLITLLLVVSAFAYSYNLLSNSICNTVNTQGFCTNWTQAGSISMDSSCFIGQTFVQEKNKGFIHIKDLSEGDMILTVENGQQTWSEVQGWLHKNNSTKSSYHNVSFSKAEWLGVSGKHNIAFVKGESYEYRFPQDNNADLKMYPSNEQFKLGQSFAKEGMYAPLTSKSSYLVFSSGKSFSVLAHDYANLRNPQTYDSIGSTILGASKVFNGEHLLNSDGINIAADWMMNTFSFMME